MAHSNDSRNRQQGLVLRAHVLIGHVQQNRRRRIVAHQGNDVDKSLPSELFLGAREGVGTDLVLADRVTTELNDDGVLFRQLRSQGSHQLPQLLVYFTRGGDRSCNFFV